MEDFDGGLQDFDFEQGLTPGQVSYDAGMGGVSRGPVGPAASAVGGGGKASLNALGAGSGQGWQQQSQQQMQLQPQMQQQRGYQQYNGGPHMQQQQQQQFQPRGGGYPQGQQPGQQWNLPYRKTVCRHWLRGLCVKGNDCSYSHQYDKNKMPICRFFSLHGHCDDQDCPFKHLRPEDRKECHMYKNGFCPNGPYCRYQHAKRPGPPPPVEVVFETIVKPRLPPTHGHYGGGGYQHHGRTARFFAGGATQQTSSYGGAQQAWQGEQSAGAAAPWTGQGPQGQGMQGMPMNAQQAYQAPQGVGDGQAAGPEAGQQVQQQGRGGGGGESAGPSFVNGGNPHQQQPRQAQQGLRPEQQGQSQATSQQGPTGPGAAQPATNAQGHAQQMQQQQGEVGGPQQSSSVPSLAIPPPAGFSRYFIVKCNTEENVRLSAEHGVWATSRSNERKLNEAFASTEHVLLIFSVNESQHFQGCARMMAPIGTPVPGPTVGWKQANGRLADPVRLGRNFRICWLKMCELSFFKTKHLRNPYNENYPVKVSRDCQEVEPNVGRELTGLLYTEPDSPLLVLARDSDRKRQEDAAAGNLGPGGGAQQAPAPSGAAQGEAQGDPTQEYEEYEEVEEVEEVEEFEEE